MSLRDAISTPAGKAPYVRRLFDTIADRYDLITVLLSYGQDQRWKRRLIDLAGPLEGRVVLDLACGTGDLAFLASDRGAHVTGLDITCAWSNWRSAKNGTRWGGSDAIRRRRHDGVAVPRPLGRRRHDRLRAAQCSDPRAVVLEIRRVLRAGGVVCRSTSTGPGTASSAWPITPT